MPAAIARLENTIIWRRTEKIDDVEAMAADCGPEVSPFDVGGSR